MPFLSSGIAEVGTRLNNPRRVTPDRKEARVARGEGLKRRYYYLKTWRYNMTVKTEETTITRGEIAYTLCPDCGRRFPLASYKKDETGALTEDIYPHNNPRCKPCSHSADKE